MRVTAKPRSRLRVYEGEPPVPANHIVTVADAIEHRGQAAVHATQLLDDSREQDHWRRDDGEEQLKTKDALVRPGRNERTVPLHRLPQQKHGYDEDSSARTFATEANRRPQKQRDRHIE